MEQDSAHVEYVVEDEMVEVKEEEVLVVEKASNSKVAVEKPRPSRWEMVKLNDYLKVGGRRSRESFWPSCPMRLVMSGLQGSTITAHQTAQLLGVSLTHLVTLDGVFALSVTH